MTIQVTIIGLGQIGGSIGLALGERGNNVQRTGTDIDNEVMAQAKAMGAIDKTTTNLKVAVRDADIIFLALPLDQVKEMVEAIAPTIKPGALVMDTTPVKADLAKWMVKTLPSSCSYIGLTPVLNPLFLHSKSFGIKAARADLFEDGLFCVATLPEVNTQAIQFAVDLIQGMGSAPLFIDLFEIDGLMAAVHILPQLISIALLNTTLNQPGWHEAKKIAGRSFAEVTGPAAHLDNAESILTAVNLNRDNITRKLDDLIAVLKEIRQEITLEEPEKLENRIKEAKTGVDTWWKERGGGNWLAEELPKSEPAPTRSQMLGRLFGFGSGRKKGKDKS